MKITTDTDERVHRAKTQKIYLVNRDVSDESATFTIMGTTGNIYEVELTGFPSCSCPDYQQQKNRCKHILFMLVKIFNADDPYQEKFTSKEIKNFIREYKKNIEKFNVSYNTQDGCVDVGAKCINDNCVVCLDSLENGESYIYCKSSCGRCIHNDCYNMVVKKSRKCPYCNMNDFVVSKIIN